MANSVFDSAVALASEEGLGWISGKWKMYLVDLDDAGPSPGGWKVSSTTRMDTGGSAPSYLLQVTTSQPHGFAVGDRFTLFGITCTTDTAWPTNSPVAPGAYFRASSSNGKKYRVVLGGTTGGSAPSFPITDGQLFVSGSVVAVCDGSETTHSHNNVYTVTEVPSTTTLKTAPTFYSGVTGQTASYTRAFVANLSKTYLSEFVSLSGRVGVSDALTGKTILANGAMDCTDPYINTPSPADPAEALLLVRTAALNADADLPDTARRLIAFISDASPLPLPANPGNQLYSIPSTGMMRL